MDDLSLLYVSFHNCYVLIWRNLYDRHQQGTTFARFYTNHAINNGVHAASILSQSVFRHMLRKGELLCDTADDLRFHLDLKFKGNFRFFHPKWFILLVVIQHQPIKNLQVLFKWSDISSSRWNSSLFSVIYFLSIFI